MALIYPVAASTYADARETSGRGVARKYVMAQFQDDADLHWVGRLRVRLAQDELKYKSFDLPTRRQVKSSDSDLYKAVENGIAQATVIVVDPEPFALLSELQYKEQHAIAGHDFTRADITRDCAVAILAGTPIAYLPEKLTLCSSSRLFFPAISLNGFAPEELLARVGGLHGAKVLAARSQAMFDVQRSSVINHAVPDLIVSPLRDLVFKEILSTARTFDKEHPDSINVLNEAADVISGSLAGSPWFQAVQRSPEPLVRESDSRAIDHLQAADFAAGWAGDMLEFQGPRTLVNSFRRVIVNGRLLD